MDIELNYLKIIITLLGGWLFGGFDSLFYALILFMSIDYVTGILLAINERKVSSDIGFKGICKKALTFLLIALGNIIDHYVIGSGSSVRTILIMFYLSNEGISILENATKMGVPFPQKLKDILQRIFSTDEK